ncbi:MAG TPA: hypothetical protein VK171_01585 [Fimbriimonas sp.]|nr:hypothetical protein [Fimbriimonas sp.]
MRLDFEPKSNNGEKISGYLFGLVPLTAAPITDKPWATAAFSLIGFSGGLAFLYHARRCQNFGEYMTIDEREVRLHFVNIQWSAPFPEIDRIFAVSVEGGTIYIIKTVGGEKIKLPDRPEIGEFISETRRRYNFKLQESNTTNISKL